MLRQFQCAQPLHTPPPPPPPPPPLPPLPQVAPRMHDRRVAEVQAQVQRWHASGLRGKKLMCTARKAFLTMSTRTATFKVRWRWRREIEREKEITC
jgi:hypothetical protein